MSAAASDLRGPWSWRSHRETVETVSFGTVLRPSVQEVPLPGEEHRHAELVSLGDALVVAHRTARLHDDGHTGRGGRLDAVGEGVEGVARAGTTLGPAGGLLGGDLAGLDPVLLPRPDPPGDTVLH